MLHYLQDNIDYMVEQMPRLIPGIKIARPDASFLLWLDCTELKNEGIADIPGFFIGAGLALNDGAMFGPGGEGFMRMNVACPRAILQKALDQLYAHYRNIIS
jgi:cystathionine beta-lyase